MKAIVPITLGGVLFALAAWALVSLPTLLLEPARSPTKTAETQGRRP
jgi:hypothetical protein